MLPSHHSLRVLACACQALEERLNDKKEQLLEKELILEEITSLSEKLRSQVGGGGECREAVLGSRGHVTWQALGEATAAQGALHTPGVRKQEAVPSCQCPHFRQGALSALSWAVTCRPVGLVTHGPPESSPTPRAYFRQCHLDATAKHPHHDPYVPVLLRPRPLRAAPTRWSWRSA